MENKKPVVVGVGELLWDVFPTGKRAGGAPINFVYHATQLGAEGYAISAVGNDPFGTEILQELDKNHIAYYIDTLSSYPTGSVKVELNNGIPSYTIIENVAWDHIPLTQNAIDLVKRADAICYGTLSLRNQDSKNTVTTLLKYARPEALRFYDINLRQHYYSKELIEELLQLANIFKVNDEELEVISKMFGISTNEEEFCKFFMDKYNLKYVIITAGDKYSYVYSKTGTSRIDTPKVTVADTVGAGDAFSGAFVQGILAGKSLKEAHKQAVEISAFVCTKTGAWPEYEKAPCAK
ncbi:carbohydrate kinase family protein [Candidatus Avelusimicrobium luingense]|uniref:carbohydrate kinase family protein n=1 Tax=Candidatus Avelusimicrobium luingense TaxID=3416211 RepID=UPI003D0DD74F